MDKISQFKERAKIRMEICKECDSLIGFKRNIAHDWTSKFTVCKECNCFMPAKVLIPQASCPLEKW